MFLDLDWFQILCLILIGTQRSPGVLHVIEAIGGKIKRDSNTVWWRIVMPRVNWPFARLIASSRQQWGNVTAAWHYVNGRWLLIMSRDHFHLICSRANCERLPYRLSFPLIFPFLSRYPSRFARPYPFYSFLQIRFSSYRKILVDPSDESKIQLPFTDEWFVVTRLTILSYYVVHE